MAAAKPPNPDWSSTRAWSPCGQSQSSTKPRTTSTRPSRNPAGTASEVPAWKAVNGVTPCHTPGMSCVDLGWGYHFARDVKDCCAPCVNGVGDPASWLLMGTTQAWQDWEGQVSGPHGPLHPPRRPRPCRRSAFDPARSVRQYPRPASRACQTSRPSLGPDCRLRHRARGVGGRWPIPACTHGLCSIPDRLMELKYMV